MGANKLCERSRNQENANPAIVVTATEPITTPAVPSVDAFAATTSITTMTMSSAVSP